MKIKLTTEQQELVDEYNDCYKLHCFLDNKKSKTMYQSLSNLTDSDFNSNTLIDRMYEIKTQLNNIFIPFNKQICLIGENKGVIEISNPIQMFSEMTDTGSKIFVPALFVKVDTNNLNSRYYNYKDVIIYEDQ